MFLYVLDALAIVVSGCLLSRIIYAKNRDEHPKHYMQIVKYTTVLLISLAFKMSLIEQYYSFEHKYFPLYTASELTMLTLFIMLKSDEDCFACFNRCIDCGQYSLYQMRIEQKDVFDVYNDESVSNMGKSDVTFDKSSGDAN